jgi:hypothetical protein
VFARSAAYASCAVGFVGALVFRATPAAAQGEVNGGARPAATNTHSPFDEGTTLTEGPPPQAIRYLQYGVAFTVEFAAATGNFCVDPALDCVLGSGGGIAGHLGWRGAGRWYTGLALEISKQDPTKLLRLAFLKQVRFEARYYLDVSKDTQPFLAGGIGFAGYGDEWAISTFGPAAFLGGGIETQVSSNAVVSIALGYRPMFLSDLSLPGVSANAGFAHMLALELAVEGKDPR